EGLVDPADEPLRPLGGLDALRKGLEALEGLDEALVVRPRPLVAALLHGALDHEERLPAAEHVGCRGDVLRIGDTRPAVVDPHALAVEAHVRRRIRGRVTRERLPEVCALEELEPGARDVYALHRIDDAADTGRPG